MKEKVSEIKDDFHISGIYGEIDEDTIGQLVSELFSIYLSNEIKHIKFLVSTTGGTIVDMFALYDVINLCKKKDIIVETIGIGKVFSAGTLLISCGTPGYRKASENTRFMIHNISSSTEGNLKDMENYMKELKNTENSFISAIEKNTKLTKKEILKFFKEKDDYYFDINTALKYGFIDGIE